MNKILRNERRHRKSRVFISRRAVCGRIFHIRLHRRSVGSIRKRHLGHPLPDRHHAHHIHHHQQPITLEIPIGPREEIKR